MRLKKKTYAIALLLLNYLSTDAQLFDDKKEFTRADTLRGMLTPDRACYDVKYYHLDIKLNTDSESISGYNDIYFKVEQPFSLMQVDLSKKLKIEKIVFGKYDSLSYSREFNAIHIQLPYTLKKDSLATLKIIYSGKPRVGKMLPWDGGLTWRKDQDGNPWVAVACQGAGASLWWPNKDHQSDEPDSMLISVTVPDSLMNISNGRLRSVDNLHNGTSRYNWFVSKPINNYDVTFNMGKFVHFSDSHISGDNEVLTLDYYVKPYNLEKAKKQFEQVKPMLKCFEKYFGKYPFYKDGYKLVETPYLGMEHQSAVAYGNNYQTGYYGSDFSGIGVDFDYIIIHESAHEWWGNNITTKDIADMWIHEGFASYAEVLYTECMYDSAKASDYANAQIKKIQNEAPVIGPYNVNTEGSGDMYPKGLAMLNTLRHVIHNDSLWFSVIKGLQTEFAYQTITSKDVENYISKKCKTDYSYIFDQYLRHTKIPKLEITFLEKGKNPKIEYRWIADVENFKMPVMITTQKDKWEFIYPTTQKQVMELKKINWGDVKVADRLFYVDVELK